MPLRARCRRLAVALACAGCAPLAFADEAAPSAELKPVAPAPAEVAPAAVPDEPAYLDDLVVTARQEQDVQTRTELGSLTKYTPLSGAVLTQQDLEDLQLVNNLLELSKRVPGISMVRNLRIPEGGRNYTESRVDGLRVSSTSNTSLLDEIDVGNLERLEVITGPGSALYGSGAVGGTLSAFTRQPPRNLQARLSQEFGEWGFQRTQARVGNSFADGRFGLLATGSLMDNGGWRTQPAARANRDSAAEHKEALGLNAQFRPSDTTRVNLGVNEVRYDYRLPGMLPLNAAEAAKLSNVAINGVNLRSANWTTDWRKSVPGTYGENYNDYLTVSGRVQQALGERAEIELAAAQRTNDGLGYGFGGSGGTQPVVCDDGSALAAPIPGGKTVKCRAVNNNSAAVTNTIKNTREVANSARVQYRQEFDWAKSTLYLGSEFIDISTDSATYNNTYNALQAMDGLWAKGSMTATGQGSLAREKDATPYVHFEISPFERLRLHLGERFDRITYSTNDRTSANRDAQRTYSAAVTKSGATYDMAPGHVLWANVAQTFSAPALSTLNASGTYGSAGYTPAARLDPERGLTHELGVRGSFREQALSYDVAYYHTAINGFVGARDCTVAERTQYNGGFACTLNENAGMLTTKGVEAMLNLAATRWLDFGASYANSRAYYNKYVTTAYDYSGKSYAWMPQERINLRVAVKPLPGLKIELEADHVSDYYINRENTATYSRPDLLTLRASYRHDRWTGWVHVFNLTDAKYATRVTQSTIGGVSNVLASSAGQGNSGTYLPMTVRVGVSYNF